MTWTANSRDDDDAVYVAFFAYAAQEPANCTASANLPWAALGVTAALLYPNTIDIFSVIEQVSVATALNARLVPTFNVTVPANRAAVYRITASR
jgi:hypothetical protein